MNKKNCEGVINDKTLCLFLLGGEERKRKAGHMTRTNVISRMTRIPVLQYLHSKNFQVEIKSSR